MAHRPSRVSPTLTRLAASAALAVVITAASADAQARIRVTADVATTLPLGSTERVADPVLAGRGYLSWLSPNERVMAGVLGGYLSQEHRLQQTPTLTATIFGAHAAWIFRPKDWGTRPYLGMQAGYANLKLNGGAQFSPPSGSESASGFFVIPEAGLTVTLTNHFGLRFNAQYVYIRSADEMLIENYRTYETHSFGLGGGVFVAF